MEETAAGYLKIVTETDHRRLEGHPLLSQLMMQDLPPHTYGRILSGFYQVVAPWELLLRGFSAAEAIPDRPIRFRCEALLTDLMELGAELELDLVINYYRPDFSFLQSSEAMCGALYVMEGSSLGSQVITKALQRDRGSPLPVRYFRGQGKDTMRYWQSMMTFLDNHLKTLEQRELAGDAARKMFCRIESAMHAAQEDGLQKGVSH